MDELRPYKPIKFITLGQVRCYFWLSNLKRVCADALIYYTSELVFLLLKAERFYSPGLVVFGCWLLLSYDIGYDYKKIIKTLQKSWKA